MRYSLEDIYYSCGRYSHTASVEFFPDTEYHRLYGKYLVGVFVYTRDECREFEKSIAFGPTPRTHGFVKFEDVLKKLDNNLRTNLLNIGFPTSEIMRLTYYPLGDRYSFASREIKELPKPIKVDVDFSDTDVDSFSIFMYEEKIKSGYVLCPFEHYQYLALLLDKHGKSIDKENYNRLFVDPATGDLNSYIYYYYLKNKYLQGRASVLEKNWFKQMNEKRTKKRVEILHRELRKASLNIKNLEKKYQSALLQLIKISAIFEGLNLTNTKYPIWLDYERFIHIFSRHVYENQLGERFSDKTSFQYDYKSIIRLIKIVLTLVDDEISKHFSQKEKRPFKRHGKKAVYYQGDYFVIDIDADGRLMTFYPLSK